jgi:small subunit ribosomal protein S6
MRIYELVFIVKPDLPEDEISQVIEQFTGAVSEGGGTVMKVEQWGKRRLAYRVKRHGEGYYVLMHYSTDDNTSLAREIERRLRVSDPVIKYITIRIDEELKRLEKLKKKREKRSGRKGTRVARRPPSTPRSTPTAAAPEAAPGKPDQAAPSKSEETKSPETPEVP